MFKAVAIAAIGVVAVLNGAEAYSASVVPSSSFELEASDAAFIQLETDVQTQGGVLAAVTKDAWLSSKEKELKNLKKEAKAAKETYTEANYDYLYRTDKDKLKKLSSSAYNSRALKHKLTGELPGKGGSGSSPAQRAGNMANRVKKLKEAWEALEQKVTALTTEINNYKAKNKKKF